jgi:catechol 2,3-dioxygenase-like lactoylglutathione lyase family enzyme
VGSRLINRRLASADFHAPAKNRYRFQFHNPDTQETEMFSHVMVGSNDIERSMRFYNAVLGVLGAGEPIRNQARTGHQRLFYRHDGATFCVTEPINDREATVANGGTIGFKCISPEQVVRFHDAAVEHGGTSIEEAPGLREGSLGALYLAYVRDPDGNKLCALHRPAPVR